MPRPSKAPAGEKGVPPVPGGRGRATSCQIPPALFVTWTPAPKSGRSTRSTTTMLVLCPG